MFDTQWVLYEYMTVLIVIYGNKKFQMGFVWVSKAQINETI
jgi:hypothetical protein